MIASGDCCWCYHAALQSDKTKALFQVAVSFEPHGMAFAPNETAILDEINANTLEGIVSVAQVSWFPWLGVRRHASAVVSLPRRISSRSCQL
jgi:protein-disulfide isomerase-like protein with CxxC motif